MGTPNVRPSGALQRSHRDHGYPSCHEPAAYFCPVVRLPLFPRPHGFRRHDNPGPLIPSHPLDETGQIDSPRPKLLEQGVSGHYRFTKRRLFYGSPLGTRIFLTRPSQDYLIACRMRSAMIAWAAVVGWIRSQNTNWSGLVHTTSGTRLTRHGSVALVNPNLDGLPVTSQRS